MFIILKLTTAHDAVNFFSRPMCFGVGVVSSVAWTNGRKLGTLLVE
jgi:hypothetical protein